MPTFLGTLSLEQGVKEVNIEEKGVALLAKHTGVEVSEIVPEIVPAVKKSTKIITDRAVVLENAAHGFRKPNILDIKLGVRLYADYAREEKKIRFDKITEETTHKELGFRIGGMRVWQGSNTEGRDDVDTEGYKVFDKSYGRSTVTKDNIHEALQSFVFNESAGIDEELGRLVCQAFMTDVQRIQEVLEAKESRMFSASLLFVFEGDGAALRTAMEEASNSPTTMTSGETAEEDDEPEIEIQLPKIYTVKVIDFAHASWTPGQGPDENSLLGVRSVARILEDLASS